MNTVDCGVAAALACVAGLGCGHAKLIPGEAAQRISGTEAAYVETDGVRCSADVGSWTGRAEELPDAVTPVKVRIKNNSGQPIRVLYEDFVLVGASGRKYYAVPPLPLATDRQGPPHRVHPTYSSTKFFVGPRFGDSYATLVPWAEPLPRDEGAYRRRYKKWGDALPDSDVIRAGLPEGVLGDGGTVSGYLYFESPFAHESRVLFHAQLSHIDASGQPDANGDAKPSEGAGDGATDDSDGEGAKAHASNANSGGGDQPASIEIPFRVD
jgi:hypothetical protein